MGVGERTIGLPRIKRFTCKFLTRQESVQRLNIKTILPRYEYSHVKDKTVVRPSYFLTGDPYSSKTTSLYWDSPQESIKYRHAILSSPFPIHILICFEETQQYIYVRSFLKTKMAQIVEIVLRWRRGAFRHISSKAWLYMTFPRKAPWRQRVFLEKLINMHI